GIARGSSARFVEADSASTRSQPFISRPPIANGRAPGLARRASVSSLEQWILVVSHRDNHGAWALDADNRASPARPRRRASAFAAKRPCCWLPPPRCPWRILARQPSTALKERG